MTFARPHFLAVGALLLLSACTERLEDTLSCPRLDILNETAWLERMAGDQVAFRGEVSSAAGRCEYDVKEETRTGKLEAEITAVFRLARGPGLGNGTAAFDYYVAVVDSHGRILNKKVFPVSTSLPTGESPITVEDRPVRLTIPLKTGTATTQASRLYHIVVGFQLSANELDRNQKTLAR